MSSHIIGHKIPSESFSAMKSLNKDDFSPVYIVPLLFEPRMGNKGTFVDNMEDTKTLAGA